MDEDEACWAAVLELRTGQAELAAVLPVPAGWADQEAPIGVSQVGAVFCVGGAMGRKGGWCVSLPARRWPAERGEEGALKRVEQGLITAFAGTGRCTRGSGRVWV